MKKTLNYLLLCCLSMFTLSLSAQIFNPEGVNMPGAWTENAGCAWSNPPCVADFASATQAGGNVALQTGRDQCGGYNVYQTIFEVSPAGPIVAGTYEWLFTSGPNGGEYNNKWAEMPDAVNTVQSVIFQGGPNNSLTLTDGWYTIALADIGYVNSVAVAMYTSAAPISITNVSDDGTYMAGVAETVTITLSGAPSAEESVYVEYTTDNWLTSSFISATCVGGDCMATIPASGVTGDGTANQYAVFTTTLASSDLDRSSRRVFAISDFCGNSLEDPNVVSDPPDVTFQVLICDEDVSNGVYVGGNFNGFDPGATQLLDDGTNGDAVAGDGIYSATVADVTDNPLIYKFTLGPNYNNAESQGLFDGGCAGTGSNDRLVNLGTSDTTLNVVAFDACTDFCPGNNQVTFCVDMSNYIVSDNGVHVTGNFNGFNPGDPNYELFDNGQNGDAIAGDGIYCGTVAVSNILASISYKFINGNSFDGVEPSGDLAACGQGDGFGGFNRSEDLPADGTVLETVCFGSCDATCPPFVQVAFNVEICEGNPSPFGVSLNLYQDGALVSTTQMTNQGNNQFSVVLTFDTNTSYAYNFSNGSEMEDFTRPLEIGENALVLTSSCYGCGAAFVLKREGALYADYADADGNETYNWYQVGGGLVASIMGKPYYSPSELGSYYVVVDDPDNTDICPIVSEARTITELNGCCELDDE